MVEREIVADRRDRRVKAEREKVIHRVVLMQNRCDDMDVSQVKKRHHETIVQMTEKYRNRRDPEGRLLN